MQQVFKRLISVLLSITFFISFFAFLPSTVFAAEVDTPVVEKAKSAYVYNFENDKIVFEKNKDLSLFPAGTVKIMTGILAVEMLDARMDEEITVTAQMLKKVVGYNIGLKEEE